MPIYVGTSGYYYKEWIGPVYPDTTHTGNMLEKFSGMFDALEINSTFYRPPTADMFKKYPERTDQNLRIVIKLNSSFTHERNAGKDDASQFDVAVKPIEETDQFSGYLAQFPQSFHNTNEAREHIERLRDLFPKAPLVVEFRHKSWWNEDTLRFLSDLGMSMCTVDLPDLPGLPPTGTTFTTEPAYIRLHGRNKEGWYEGRDERYTWKYKKGELDGILEKVKKLVLKSDEVMVIFNNHPLGNAAINAAEFVEILRDILPDSLPAPKKDRPGDTDQLGLF
jgi:uncharacterized protein YecE (DUF72 family)